MKRVAMGFVWFLVFCFGISPIFAPLFVAISAHDEQGASAQQSPPDTYEVSKKASKKFAPFIVLGSIVLAVAGTASGVLPGTKRRKKAETNEQ